MPVIHRLCIIVALMIASSSLVRAQSTSLTAEGGSSTGIGNEWHRVYGDTNMKCIAEFTYPNQW